MKLDPEDQLLMGLIRPEPDAALTAGRAGSSRAFSWDVFQQRAVSWGLGPLAHHRLREAGPRPAVPEAVMRRLRDVQRHSAVRNSLVLHHLGRLAARFDAAGIPVILLKGAEFMQRVYPHPSLRVVYDLDLLVRRDRVDEGEALLAAAGFTTDRTNEREWHDEHLHHGLPWRSADGAISVELHWDLVRRSDPFRLECEGIWSRALEFPMGGNRALRLSCRDNIEYLSVHFFRHLTSPDGAFRSLADLALLLRTPESQGVDWESLASAGALGGTLLPMALSFWALAEMLPAPDLLPRAAMLEQLLDDAPTLRRSKTIARELFRLRAQQPIAVSSGFTGLGQAQGAAGKLRFLLRGLLPHRSAVNRDLAARHTRLPLFLRYGALVFTYTRELIQLGPRAGLASYRLGQLRGKLERKLRRD